MINVGAEYLGGDRCQFTVWAPLASSVAVELVTPKPRQLPMQPLSDGYWQVTADNVSDGSQYRFRLSEENAFPDPASHYQPEGVHGPSQIVDHRAFQWRDDDWQGISLQELVIYELHVGTFTPDGIFEAVIERLPRLKELGITAIELMPVAQFPGDRNWGYDGVLPFAVQKSYGGPDGLKALVDACHREGMAVVLDVVYNHLGPEGNYLGQFAPYFTPKYRVGWGDAVNFDDEYSDGVRDYFIQNALYWLEQYHIDALRLDAVHGIYDFGALHFLEELAETVKDHFQGERSRYLIAESDLNDVRIIRPRSQGGYGLDAQWSDDFHHALHTLLTHEQQGYYKDFGHCEQLATVLQDGFAYAGSYSPHRKRRHGNSAVNEPAYRFVVCIQNHDQIGNRALGERLTQLTSFEGLKLAAGTVLLSPFIPMLYMGEEYGEEAPFLYFISHSDPDLIEAVRQGRQAEFPEAGWSEDVQDPQDAKVFEKSKLHWDWQFEGQHQVLWAFYQHLLTLRRNHPVFRQLDKTNQKIGYDEASRLIWVHRYQGDRQILQLMNFGDRPATLPSQLPTGSWQKQVDSADAHWKGVGTTLPEQFSTDDTVAIPAQCFAVYDRL